MTTETTLAQTPPWTADDRTFGARLALIRQRMNWNLKEAATTCGLPTATWTAWERGGSAPRNIVTVAKQIAGASGCDFLWLLAGPDGVDRRLPASGPLTPRLVKTINPDGVIPPEQIDRTRRPVLLHHPISHRSSRPLTPTAA